MDKKPKKTVAVLTVGSKKTAEELRQDNIKNILETAGKQLDALGVKYFAGVLDKQPNTPDGGKAYVQSDIEGNDFGYILDMAFPTNQDIISLGIYVGQVIQSRNKKPQTLKGN